MRTFKLDDKDPNDYGFNIYNTRKFTFEPGISVLIGCNGYGKSTMLTVLKSLLRDKNIPCISFDNLRDGGSNARSRAAAFNNFTFVATSMCSSEGENIIMNVGNLARHIGDDLREKYFDASEIWILLDAVDSGLSIDNVIELKEFFKLVIDTNPNKDIYIIVSANEYEMAHDQKCFDVYTGKYRCIRTYHEYKKFILRSRDLKNKRKYK